MTISADVFILNFRLFLYFLIHILLNFNKSLLQLVQVYSRTNIYSTFAMYLLIDIYTGLFSSLIIAKDSYFFFINRCYRTYEFSDILEYETTLKA